MGGQLTGDALQSYANYCNYRCDLVLEDSLTLKGNHAIVPESLYRTVLEAIHTGHQGETKAVSFLPRYDQQYLPDGKGLHNMQQAPTISANTICFTA